MYLKNSICSPVGKAVVVAVFSLLLACGTASFIPAYGQVDGELEGNYEEYFGDYADNSKAGQFVAEIRSAMVRFLKVVVGMASLASLILSAYNMFTGEQSGAKRFFLWGIGLIVGWTLLTVLSNVEVAANPGVGFGGLQGTVAEVLEIVLSIICMVTLAVVVIHIMNGEKDGFQKFFRWLLVSGAGLLLMEVVRINT